MKFSNILNFLSSSKVKKHLGTFSFFLLISTIFWFLNALNKEYSTEIRFPVSYYNYPQNKVLIGDLPNKLNLKIKGFGFKILKYKLSSIKPIEIEVNSKYLSQIDVRDSTKYFIHTEFTQQEIAGQIGTELEIIDISPDSLIFQFTENRSKKVAVQTDFNIQYRKQYLPTSDLLIRPDSVIISGAFTIIDTIKEIKTRRYNFLDVYNSLEKEIRLKPIMGVSFSPIEVHLSQSIEKFTEAFLRIPIQKLNTPDSVDLQLFPDHIKVTYLISLSKYETISENQFRAYVDFKEVQTHTNKKLKVWMLKHPKNLESLNFYPQKVEYIIEKKSKKK